MDYSPLLISLKVSVQQPLLRFSWYIFAYLVTKLNKFKVKGRILTLPLVLPPTVVGFSLNLLREK